MDTWHGGISSAIILKSGRTGTQVVNIHILTSNASKTTFGWSASGLVGDDRYNVVYIVVPSMLLKTFFQDSFHILRLNREEGDEVSS